MKCKNSNYENKTRKKVYGKMTHTQFFLQKHKNKTWPWKVMWCATMAQNLCFNYNCEYYKIFTSIVLNLTIYFHINPSGDPEPCKV
jgi:hypothetical protein